LKIRYDAVVVSSVLFTLALLIQVPVMWRAAETGCGVGPWHSGVVYRFQDCIAPVGFASLSVIVIGLIVAWTGYIRGVRWAWMVMFVIVWVWAFPVLMLGFLHPWQKLASFPLALASALREFPWEGPLGPLARLLVEASLSFLLMVFALVLPAKTFMQRRGSDPGEIWRADSEGPRRPTSPGI